MSAGIKSFYFNNLKKEDLSILYVRQEWRYFPFSAWFYIKKENDKTFFSVDFDFINLRRKGAFAFQHN